MNRLRCGRLARRHTGSFVISSYGLPAGYAMEPHAHERAGLAVVLSGQFCVKIEGTELEGTAGEIIVLPAGATHIERARPGAQCLLVELDEVPHLEGFEKLVQHPGLWQSAPAEAIGVRLAADVFGADSRGLVLDADATELFLELQTDQDGPLRVSGASHLVKRIVDALEQRWRHPPPMGDLARELGISAEHMARSFRSATGCTIGDYLRRQRLLNAAQLLRDSPLPLATIAHWAGYADQSHMTRQFSRYLGLTPGAYRSRG